MPELERAFNRLRDGLDPVDVSGSGDDAYRRALSAGLEQIIPCQGPLQERMSAYRDRFLVPPEYVERIVPDALTAARVRTRANMDLPEEEGITLLMNNFGSFGAFAEYLGKGKTNVHFSTTMPFHVDRAIELATHEAYPGHHVQATLLEAEMIDNRGWQEFTMLPQAGLAHLAPDIEDYHRYVDYVERLNQARNEAARRLLYQSWDRARDVEWLMDFGLETRTIAEARLTIIEAIRSYVITYNYGLDWARNRIEGADTADIAQKWARLRALFEAPVMPVRARWGMTQRRP